MYDFHSA
jgi:hypothetical protein